MTRSRQKASRIQCATDALREGGPFVSKLKNILGHLRATHTEYSAFITLLKHKAVGKLLALILFFSSQSLLFFSGLRVIFFV